MCRFGTETNQGSAQFVQGSVRVICLTLSLVVQLPAAELQTCLGRRR